MEGGSVFCFILQHTYEVTLNDLCICIQRMQTYFSFKFNAKFFMLRAITCQFKSLNSIKHFMIIMKVVFLHKDGGYSNLYGGI